jgi:hypothetical protein
MNKGTLNVLLMLIGVALLISSWFVGGHTTIVILAIFLNLVGFGCIVFGLVNYTKLKLWQKVVITVVLIPILFIIFFFLAWGYNSGWTWSM